MHRSLLICSLVLCIPQSIITTAAQATDSCALAQASTEYHYEFIQDNFVSNEVLHGVLRGQTYLMNQGDACGTPGTLYAPRLTLTSDYPIVHMFHNPEYLIPNSTYQWAYPDMSVSGEDRHVDATFDPEVISVTYIPGFLLSRSVSPKELSYPGGTQTLTIDITPLESHVDSDPLNKLAIHFGWDFRFGFDSEGPIHRPTIISYTSTAPEHIFQFDFDVGNYSCFIYNPAIGNTYTVKVTYDIEFDNGVTAVETVPGVVGQTHFGGDWSLYYGKTVTLESEGATWMWETANDVDGMSNEWFIKSVALIGYEIPQGQMLQVSIDIKPSSSVNPINTKSAGEIPVAILTTDDFDATSVDPLSVEFGPNRAMEAHGKGHIEDVDIDGDLDLVLHFNNGETGITCGDTEADLTGETFAGQTIEGMDSINTMPCN